MLKLSQKILPKNNKQQNTTKAKINSEGDGLFLQLPAMLKDARRGENLRQGQKPEIYYREECIQR